jgi:hypothetical protein
LGGGEGAVDKHLAFGGDVVIDVCLEAAQQERVEDDVQLLEQLVLHFRLKEFLQQAEVKAQTNKGR